MTKQRKIQYGTFSGSTLHTMTSIKSRAIKLAEKTGRQARLIELDPKYCDVIVQRWEEFTGKKAERIEGQ